MMPSIATKFQYVNSPPFFPSYSLHADDVNLFGDNIDTIKKNRETWIIASKDVDLEINVEKTKYRLLSHHQNVDQNQDIKIANR
jgi:hypothetical protein